ncbi:hypothetical protein CKO15_06765 [Halorhodospira abdelmalekii]|nr:hypothetical protein [Halorhodospira abdelmalekii]
MSACLLSLCSPSSFAIERPLDATVPSAVHGSASSAHAPQNLPQLASTVVRSEGLQWIDAERPAERAALLDFTTHIEWLPHPDWDLHLGLRLYAERQHGSERSNDWEASGDYDESFVRYRTAKQRITLGAQRVRWGQMDYRPPTNRLAAHDRRHFPVGDRSEQLPIPALRWEHFGDHIDTEWLWLPYFRAARLPEADDPWYPVDQHRGLVAGIDLDPALAPWLGIATIIDDTPSGSGGAGLRLRGSTPQIDYALSAQRARRSMPYYELGPEVPPHLRTALTRGELPQQLREAIDEEGAAALWERIAGSGTPLTVRARYPYATIFGGDLAWTWRDTVWRAEAAWLSDVPATTAQLDYTTVPGFEWAVAFETFPFESEVRLIVQLSGDHRLDDRALLDPAHAYTVSGGLERYWQRQRWRTRLRYLLGYEPRQRYLNPQVAYLGRDAQEFFAEVHWFDGARHTPIGYYRHHDLVLLGWRIHYH